MVPKEQGLRQPSDGHRALPRRLDRKERLVLLHGDIAPFRRRLRESQISAQLQPECGEGFELIL
jgi:hypothetical protein